MGRSWRQDKAIHTFSLQCPCTSFKNSCQLLFAHCHLLKDIWVWVDCLVCRQWFWLHFSSSPGWCIAGSDRILCPFDRWLGKSCPQQWWDRECCVKPTFCPPWNRSYLARQQVAEEWRSEHTISQNKIRRIQICSRTLLCELIRTSAYVQSRANFKIDCLFLNRCPAQIFCNVPFSVQIGTGKKMRVGEVACQGTLKPNCSSFHVLHIYCL